MTTVVRRFPLVDLAPDFRMSMPAGAKILGLFVEESVFVSDRGRQVIYDPHLWALVDPTAGWLPRSFVLAASETPVVVPEGARFVGTFSVGGPALHLWDLGDGT